MQRQTGLAFGYVGCGLSGDLPSLGRNGLIARKRIFRQRPGSKLRPCDTVEPSVQGDTKRERDLRSRKDIAVKRF